MTWTTTNPVSIGAATKKSHYDALWDNCDFLKIDHNTDGTHEKLTVGSDADGDMYYRASGVLARLAKGTAGQVLVMNAGATAPSYEGGAWVTPTFSAGDFTASGSMTWTVEAGDVGTYAYHIVGKKMTVAFIINTTTVGGTPSNSLYIKIPASKVPTKAMKNTCIVYDGTAYAAGRVELGVAGTVLMILKMDSSNWTAGANDHYVQGEIEFEIN